MTRLADSFRLPFVVELQQSFELEPVDTLAAYWHLVRAFEGVLLRAVEEAGIPQEKHWTLGRLLEETRRRSILPSSLAPSLGQVVQHRNILAHARLDREETSDFSADRATVVELFRWYLAHFSAGPRLSLAETELLLSNVAVRTANPCIGRKVFLCYAKEDVARVATIYDRLRQRNHRPWMDKKDLLPGQAWEEEIERVIKAADFFVACMSRHSVSKRGYVQKEVRVALDFLGEIPSGQIYLIPIQLEPCDIPPLLQKLHWIELDGEDAYLRLFEAIESS